VLFLVFRELDWSSGAVFRRHDFSVEHDAYIVAFGVTMDVQPFTKQGEFQLWRSMARSLRRRRCKTPRCRASGSNLQWQDGNLNAPMRVFQVKKVPAYCCAYQKVHPSAGSTLIEL
jgi:hypothetical protein